MNDAVAPVETIRGVSVPTCGRNAVLEMLMFWADERVPCRYFAGVNAHSAEVARRDRSFMTALEWSAMLVPDGPSVRLVSRLMEGAIHDRVTGPEIFFGLSQRLAAAAGLTAHRFSQRLRRYSGVFPSSESWLWRFAAFMQEIARELDILGWRRAEEASLRPQ